MTSSIDWSQYSEVYHQYSTGIYGLINRSRDRVYVGATAMEFLQRWAQHRSQLEVGSHGVSRLQQDWWLDGPHVFSFVVFQELPPRHPRMHIYEQFWLDGFRDSGLYCYNSALPIYHAAATVNWPRPAMCAPPPLISTLPPPTIEFYSKPETFDIVIYNKTTWDIKSFGGWELRLSDGYYHAVHRLAAIRGRLTPHFAAAIVKSGTYRVGDRLKRVDVITPDSSEQAHEEEALYA